MNNQLKDTLLEAIKESGAMIVKKFRKPFEIYQKDSVNNLVTEVDQASEKLIRKRILENFPNHGIIGEEFEIKETKTEYKWIIDPIDGTTNFAHGLPLFCISIGLMKGAELIMGAVYNPILEELFFAEKGKGASLNGHSIHVSNHTQFEDAFLVTGFPYYFPEDQGDITNAFSNLVKKGLPVRRLGAAALDLCWVACGRFDGFWEYNLQPWDVAAGYLIVREAGGQITDFNGQEATIWGKETLATNGKIHQNLWEAVKPKA